MWHQATRKWREDGRLRLVGIVQEQHPARTRLFAQWHEIDWPILWDPLNVTGSAGIPRLVAIDEHGVVRSLRPSLETFEDEFLDVEFPAPESDAERHPTAPDRLLAATALPEEHAERAYYDALSDLLWKGDEHRDDAVAVLEERVEARPDDAVAAFRLGVAYRMRHDSGRVRRGDFQRAIDHWSGALALNPRQYIWRRRIQQYGPLLDKPYPFYDWVMRAVTAVLDRGDVPLDMGTGLSSSERAQPDRGGPGEAGGGEAGGGETAEQYAAALSGEPDEDGWLAVEPVVVFDTSGKTDVARVYLGIHADRGRELRWDSAAGEAEVRFAPGAVRAERVTLSRPAGDEPPLFASRWRELDVRLTGGGPHVLKGHVIVPLRPGKGGTTRLVRHAFEIPLDRPR